MKPESSPLPSALREEEAFLALADTLSALIVLIQGDKLVYVNPAGCALLGRAREDFAGRNFWDFVPPEQQEAVQRRGRLRQQGVEQPRRYVERLRHADGHDLWIDYSVDVIRLDGKPTTLVTGHDITEQKRTEEALRLSDERFRSAFQNAAIGKTITHPSMRFLQVNRAFCDMLGYTEAEMLAQTPITLSWPEDEAQSRAFIETILSGRQASGRMVKRYRGKDGRVVWGDLTTTLMRDAEGKPSYFVSEIIDITERRSAEEQLRQREASLNESQSIAHVGSWTWDVPSDKVVWSEELHRIWGIPPEKFGGTFESVFSRIHPEDRPVITAHVMRALEDGKPVEFEYRIALDDGRQRHLWSSCLSRRNAAGKVDFMWGIAQDITERRDREAKLAEAQRVAHVGSWEYDVAADRSAWSDETFRIMGLDPAVFVPTRENSFTRIHPDDRGKVAAFVDAAILQGASFEQEARIVRPGGEVRHLLCIGRAERNAAGKTIRLYGVFQDITDRRRSEEALRLSDERFRAAFQNAAIGKVIASPSLKFLQVNKAFCDMLGYTEAELLALSPAAVTPEEDRPAGLAFVARLLSGQASSDRLIKRYLHKTGRIVWGDLAVNLVRDAEGRPSYFAVEVVDVTERKRTDELLRDREAKLAESQRVAHIGSWDHDIAANLSTWSEETYRIAGLDPASFVPTAENALAQVHPEDRPRMAAVVERAIREGTPYEEEARIVRGDGQIRWLLFIGRAERGPSGAPVRLYGVFQDITERRRAEELLRDREAKLAEAQRIAHVGSWEWDIVGGRMEWSDECYRLFGVDPAAFTPTFEGVLSRIPAEDAAPVRETLERILRTGGPFEAEHRIRRDDGELRSVWVSGRVDLDAAGRPLRMVAVSQDITERKRSEEALRASRQSLAEAQRLARIGSWEYDIATNSSEWSDEMYRIFGVDPARFNPSKEESISRFHPDDQARVGALVARSIETGEPIDFECRVVRDDGEIRVIQAVGRVKTGAAGKPLRLYGTLQDVTERRRADDALRASQANLAEAQRLAHVGSWEWNLGSGRVTWSEELYRIFGVERDPDATDLDSTLARLHPEDRARTAAVMERVLKEGTPFEIENRAVRPDGEVRTLWTSGRADLGPDGKPVRLYGATQDITARKETEGALLASEQRFRSLSTQAPVMMVAFNSEGRIREVSNYWLQTMGYERQEVLGQEGWRFLTPASAARLREEVERNTAAGELVHRNIPLQAVRKDGTVIDALVTSVFEVDDQGRPLGAIAVSIDVTEFKRAEDAVRESEARYRSLVEHAPEGILVLDVETGRFVDHNPNAEKMFGYSREQLLSMGPLDMCPQTQACGTASKDVAWSQIGRVMKGESPVFEFIHTDAAGREIPCQIRLSRLPATGRELIRATITDISELKALQEKIRHAEKMAAIGVLAAGVAHEVGNPLLALSMAAQSLERKIPDEFAQKKLGLIREHIERISKIVRQMSDLARPPSFQKTACDVNRVLERSLEVVRYDKRAKEVAIRFEPCPDIPFVEAVEDQLVQVCLNLGLNALDAVAANPPEREKALRIRVRCVQKNGRRWVRAGFADTGPGIPEAARGKIFQPFFTTKHPGKGTGLGLSVSYRLIEEHQGTLAFENGAPAGTEFFFELPVKAGP